MPNTPLCQILTGDALAVLHTLPSNTYRCCITSPPYFGLRDYGVEGQLGLEQTPVQYVDQLVEVFNEVRRVLCNDGTLWLNIADSYCTTKTGSLKNASTLEGGKANQKAASLRPDKSKIPGCKPKDLIGIPWLLAFALRSSGWYLRQDIIWHKTNPMPESVKDRCTKSHEHIFLLSKQSRYYYNAAAIAEPTVKKVGNENIAFGGNKYGNLQDNLHRTKNGNMYVPNGKRNKRDVWSIATCGYKGAHFATFPPQLVRPCILAGSEKGDMVLDPFIGSGTTGVVAMQEGRGCVGIELNPQYAEMAAARIELGSHKQLELTQKEDAA